MPAPSGSSAKAGAAKTNDIQSDSGHSALQQNCWGAPVDAEVFCDCLSVGETRDLNEVFSVQLSCSIWPFTRG